MKAKNNQMLIKTMIYKYIKTQNLHKAKVLLVQEVVITKVAMEKKIKLLKLLEKKKNQRKMIII